MIGWLAMQLVPFVGERFAKAVAWLLIVLTVVLLIVSAKSCYDEGVVDDYTRDANADFIEQQDEAEVEAGAESEARAESHAERVETTGELVDEAIEKGCSVGEYLASDGARCL